MIFEFKNCFSRRAILNHVVNHSRFITVFVSVPLVDPIVCLTVVTVSKEAIELINTENITRPTKKNIMANNFAGIDFGQRSPYLQHK